MTTINLSSRVRSSIFKILGSKSFKVTARKEGLYRMEITINHNQVGYVKELHCYPKKFSQEEVLSEIYNNEEVILEAFENRLESKRRKEEKELELKREIETYSVSVNGTNFYDLGFSDGYNDNFCTYADSPVADTPDFPNDYAKTAYYKGYDRGNLRGYMDT